MSTDFAFTGAFVFESRASLHAFTASRPAQDEIESRAYAKRKTFVVEGVAEKSIFWSDVMPVLEAMCDAAAKGDAKGTLEIVDVGGAGFRLKLERGEVRRYDLAEEEAQALWMSDAFARVRKRLEKTARALVGPEVPVRIVASPRNVAEARHALEHGELCMIGEADGVNAARLLLDRDESDEAVDRVLSAVARKWARIQPPMMRGEDEPIVRSVLVHHAHPRIGARVIERLRTLEASTTRDRAATRVIEGLAYVLRARA